MTKARDIASAIPAPSTVSSAELGYLDGVTSAIQTQLGTKQAVVALVDDTEIGYLNGVTSAIQTQIDSKIGSASAISPTIVDAKGDIIAATADNTVSRVAVGANNTILTADSAEATGIKWATAASPSYTWTAFTPVITQSGGMTFSTNNSVYLVIGDVTVVSLDVTISNAGTANTMIFYLPPTPPGPNKVNGRTMAVGTCRLYDDSAATSYFGAVTTSGGTYTFSSGVAKATPQWGATGSDFTLALASGDVLSGIYTVRTVV